MIVGNANDEKKNNRFLKVIILVLALLAAWHYLTVTALTYGPFEVQVITPEPMEDIVLVISYDHGRTFGLRDDIYRHVKIVSSGEWVTFPAGKFQYLAKPTMRVSLYHPNLSSTTLGLISKDDMKLWDGGYIKVHPIKARLFQGKGSGISGHFMRMNDTYLKYMPRHQHKKLHKYVSVLEQQIDSASDASRERSIDIARKQLEQFKAATE